MIKLYVCQATRRTRVTPYHTTLRVEAGYDYLLDDVIRDEIRVA